MIYPTLFMVLYFSEQIAGSTTGRYYDREKKSRVLASETKKFELGRCRQGSMPIDCLSKCEDFPACRAVNAFSNGTCEVVLSPVLDLTLDPDCTAYIDRTCPDGNLMITSGHTSCYKFVLDRLFSWYDAPDHCDSLGGHLAAIETAEEMAHILNVIRSDPNLLGKRLCVNGIYTGTWKWTGTDTNVDMTLVDRTYFEDSMKQTCTCGSVRIQPTQITGMGIALAQVIHCVKFYSPRFIIFH